ncbi:hypothetical protein P700755_001177 [Psychroflexus torquis ATCC 700755]|uniref:Uncharacterized protein n=1 Tax=Psychroflexus torquis (strain ATCC 700755 / CIP 106069 / ACAM 623) TaxID=313595 RepID=K4IGE0_PSYTT|nr:hypothetical protein P700755_001177 [Psychroflexus torquis ATCC 700755]
MAKVLFFVIAIFEGTVFNSSSIEELVSDMYLSNGTYT